MKWLWINGWPLRSASCMTPFHIFNMSKWDTFVYFPVKEKCFWCFICFLPTLIFLLTCARNSSLISVTFHSHCCCPGLLSCSMLTGMTTLTETFTIWLTCIWVDFLAGCHNMPRASLSPLSSLSLWCVDWSPYKETLGYLVRHCKYHYSQWVDQLLLPPEM